MKCKFCGADIIDQNAKCEFCGKYQNEPESTPTNNYKSTIPQKKNSKIGLFISLGVALVVIITVVLILLLSSGSKDYLFEGKWLCSNGKDELELDSKNFIYKSPDISIHATFTIDYDEVSESSIGKIHRYGITASTTNRVIYGEKNTDPYTTTFEIDIDENDQDTLYMINSVTYNMYECYRSK